LVVFTLLSFKKSLTEISFKRTAVPPMDCALSVPLWPFAVEFSFADVPAPLCVDVAVAVCDSEFDALLAGLPLTDDAELPLAPVLPPVVFGEEAVEVCDEVPVALCGDVLLLVGFANADADAPNASATAVAIKVRFIKKTLSVISRCFS